MNSLRKSFGAAGELTKVRVDIGATEFEPATSRSESERSTRLSYAPSSTRRSGDRLSRFLERALFFTFLSAVVMQELAAGARTPAQHRDLERSVFEPFVRRGRVFTPSANGFVESGRVIAGVAAREGWSAVHQNPALLNDALLATSCREQGIVLVTSDGDFDRFASVLKDWRTIRPGQRSPESTVRNV